MFNNKQALYIALY